MKRILTFILCVIMIICTVSCQKGEKNKQTENTTDTTVAAETELPPAPHYAVLLPVDAGGKVIAAGKAVAARLRALGGEVTVAVGQAEGDYACRILLGEIGDGVYKDAIKDLEDEKYRLVCDGNTLLIGGKTEDDVVFGAKALINRNLNKNADALTTGFSRTSDTFYTKTPDVNTVSTSVKNGSLVLASYFADHMILQADRDFTVSGTSAPGTSVKALLTKEDGTKVSESEATVFGSGYFEVELPAVKGGYDAYTLTVTGNGGDSVELEDVLFGEVWIASGQSNMEYKLKHAMEKDGSYALDVLKKDEYLRGLTFYPDNAKWFTGNIMAIGGVSAVAYYCARQLRSVLDVPVAVVDATYGGTDLYAWLDLADLRFNDTAFSFVSTTSLTVGNYYAERVYPMRGMQVRGLLWYQGENNHTNTPGTYREGFEVLRESFAYLFGYDTGASLPAVVSHIAPYKYGNAYDTALGVFAQEFDAIVKAHPETTAQVTVYNEPLDYESKVPNYSCNTLHPSVKEGIGTNMGKAAYGLVYGGSNEATAPSLCSVEKKDGVFYVTFDHVGDTLTAGRNGRIYGFTVCGENRIYLPAEAEVVSPDTVKVSCESIADPVAVMYAYTDMNDTANLCSTADGKPLFAAVPFAYGEKSGDTQFSPYQWAFCEDETLWHTFGSDGGYYPTWKAKDASLSFSEQAYRGSGALELTYTGKSTFSAEPLLAFGTNKVSDMRRGFLSYSGLSVAVKGDAEVEELIIRGEESDLHLTPQTRDAGNGWTVCTFIFEDAGMSEEQYKSVLRKVMELEFVFLGTSDSGKVLLDEVSFMAN